ncbi:MAG TPA: arylamine N-acetyltransferase [Polyangiaceae bacterium]
MDKQLLDAYFERIAYGGPAEPTLEVLRALHALHPAAVPFENLSPLSGEPVALELPSVRRKLIDDQRGGYCFEHNTLFLAVLRALGFRASGLAARVLWNQPEEALTARGHMLLRVELDSGTFLADVGFGGMTLTAPLSLEETLLVTASRPCEGAPQPTPHGSFRLARGAHGDLSLQADVRGEFRSLYRFDLSPAYPVDYEVSNYYLSTHPQSHFRSGLIAARSPQGRRFALRNRTFTHYPLDGAPETRELSSLAELQEILASVFQIRPSTEAPWAGALKRLFPEDA